MLLGYLLILEPTSQIKKYIFKEAKNLSSYNEHNPEAAYSYCKDRYDDS